MNVTVGAAQRSQPDVHPAGKPIDITLDQPFDVGQTFDGAGPLQRRPRCHRIRLDQLAEDGLGRRRARRSRRSPSPTARGPGGRARTGPTTRPPWKSGGRSPTRGRRPETACSWPRRFRPRGKKQYKWVLHDPDPHLPRQHRRDRLLDVLADLHARCRAERWRSTTTSIRSIWRTRRFPSALCRR